MKMEVVKIMICMVAVLNVWIQMRNIKRYENIDRKLREMNIRK